MKTRPLVSVIIPFFDDEKFIGEAIASVFGQTYEEWELLLVDDGSTDSSTSIARYYAESHPGKVRYLDHPNHQNRGANASRNLGIRHARGKYLALLDSDDVWVAHKLRRQVDILESHIEASMVYGSTRYWISWTGKPEDARHDFVPELGIPSGILYKPPALLTLLYPLASAAAPQLSNPMFQREMAERVGGFEESFMGKYQMYSDHSFLTKVYLREAVFVSEECWNLYRLHANSMVAAAMKAGQYYRRRLFFLEWFAGYLSSQEVKDAKIWMHLREEQRIARVRLHMQEREWQQAMLAALMLLRHHPRRVIRRLRALIISPPATTSPSSWHPYSGEPSNQ